MDVQGLTLATVTEFTERDALAYFEAIRWPNGAVCVRCDGTNVIRLNGKSTRLGVFKCRACRKPFTVKVGTILEDSHIPLQKWAIAFHMMCSSKKGYSAKQLQRNLGLRSYKSAWHMAHRIREAMKEDSFAAPLAGDVEIDETYVGGKKIGQGVYAGKKAKAPVVSLVERNGDVRSFHMPDVTAENLGIPSNRTSVVWPKTNGGRIPLWIRGKHGKSLWPMGDSLPSHCQNLQNEISSSPSERKKSSVSQWLTIYTDLKNKALENSLERPTVKRGGPHLSSLGDFEMIPKTVSNSNIEEWSVVPVRVIRDKRRLKGKSGQRRNSTGKKRE